MANKKLKYISCLLALALLCSNAAFVAAADTGGAPVPDQLISSTDFEDGDTWGFIPGGGATAVVDAEEGGNHYLNAGGSGSGTRQIVKTLVEPTDSAAILMQFDWKPGEVSTATNSSEVLISDANGSPLLRLAKAGGPDGGISYGIGTTGTDLSGNTEVTGVSKDGSWLEVEMRLDFISETASLSVSDKANAANSFAVSDISFSALNYTNHIASITLRGNRASGNTLGFTAGIDNMGIYGSAEAAPAQGLQQITVISSVYDSSITIEQGTLKEAVIASFPSQLDVKLDNDAILSGMPVAWDSADYDANQLGSYTFTGTLDPEGIPNVANDGGVEAVIAVTVIASSELPVIEGFDTVYYTDFGDTADVIPPNWGFATANAALSIHEGDLAGNATPKLQFAIENQSGGRVASKTFGQAVKGNRILVAFDWYPGQMNDKGANPNENGGEFRVLDASNNIVFTLNYTNNAAFTYFAGGRAETAEATAFTDPEAWYRVEIEFDLSGNAAELKLTSLADESTESHTVSLDGVAFDGSVATVRLVGLRTSGNNQTWTSYLDNFGVYNVSIPDNTIVSVDPIPYVRVYAGETGQDFSSIGLPQTVQVTLADSSKAQAEISEWTTIGSAWNPAVAGVYEFRGELADSEELDNSFERSATVYVYNRLLPPDTERQAEWLDRGVIALKADDGIFVSWRLLADEYDRDVMFNLYRNGEKLNEAPLAVTNFLDEAGAAGDSYSVETLVDGASTETNERIAAENDYLSIPLQKPEGGTTATGDYTYTANDAGVGDLDGDGQYEVIVKWYPTNSIDSSQQGMTGPTIFDAYRMDGTLLWRMNMGLNLTSGAHYNQFIVADLDGDGKSEMLIKTADGTTVYGATDGMADESKLVSQIGNPADNGIWVNEQGHIVGGPEYMTAFNGETGEVIDTVDYAFPLGDVASWGDTWYNRSDRFLAGLAYLDGVKPSAVFGRGYYERTTFVAYSLVNHQLVQEWTFDSAAEGRGGGLGYHSLATGDVDNDGYDEIVAGSLTLDQDGSILYVMDGEMGRVTGSHGDALHLGAFDPDREGLQVFGVHEVPAVASVEYHDAATGETLDSYYAFVDAGRGLAANIASAPGYEFWGTGGADAESGGGIYNVQGEVLADSFRNAGLSVNFALYWDGDLQQELLDQTSISKYNEETGQAETIRSFDGVVSNNGTKATPSLQADILGDWREEVLLPSEDSSELRIYSTTTPTEYRLYTLMHDPVYRNAIAWQNTAYNQPPHLGFYLGEDVRYEVLAGELHAPKLAYTNGPSTEEPESPDDTGTNTGGVIQAPSASVEQREDGSVLVTLTGRQNASTGELEATLGASELASALAKAAVGENGKKRIELKLADVADAIRLRLPTAAGEETDFTLTIESASGIVELPARLLREAALSGEGEIDLLFSVDRIGESGEAQALSWSETEELAAVMVAVEAGGNQLPLALEGEGVQVTVPYALTEEEAREYERLAVVYIGEDGGREPVYLGRYREDKEAFVFEAAQSGKYVLSLVQKTFGDLAHHEWARHAVESLAAKGIVSGISETNGLFGPDASITRADFLLLLMRSLGLKAEGADSFDDVPLDAYYAEAVLGARALGIASGSGDNRFDPMAPISRQDMMTLASRALEAAGMSLHESDAAALESYRDKALVANYALEAAASLIESKLIVGADGMLNPQDETSRAEAAVFLYRIYQLED
ncbi:S-layer homology domain-containing protein [Paenibacillus sp. HB172176]|uniref:rhamnogalacturonan lyase family protein n=1 Tax=Paenibacillus sp. HB172176 TaxID=2493690 RepID=UPI001439D85D|nr:S-layer homology domain-containing protein [Paenibacillus sp. HB172176]